MMLSTTYHPTLASHDPIEALAAGHDGMSILNSATSPSLEECMSAWVMSALTSVSMGMHVADSLSISIDPGQSVLEVMDNPTRHVPMQDGLVGSRAA
jgi:hypothetical protein